MDFQKFSVLGPNLTRFNLQKVSLLWFSTLCKNNTQNKSHTNDDNFSMLFKGRSMENIKRSVFRIPAQRPGLPDVQVRPGLSRFGANDTGEFWEI